MLPSNNLCVVLLGYESVIVVAFHKKSNSHGEKRSVTDREDQKELLNEHFEQLIVLGFLAETKGRRVLRAPTCAVLVDNTELDATLVRRCASIDAQTPPSNVLLFV